MWTNSTTQTEHMWTYSTWNFSFTKSPRQWRTHDYIQPHVTCFACRTHNGSSLPSLTFLGWTGGVDHWRKTHTTHMTLVHRHAAFIYTHQRQHKYHQHWSDCKIMNLTHSCKIIMEVSKRVEGIDHPKIKNGLTLKPSKMKLVSSSEQIWRPQTINYQYYG